MSKKLIVVSSVLATCMLFSISVLALSGQEETANADENSAAILSEGDTVPSDVLEKVVFEKIGDEQMTEIQIVFALIQKVFASSTVATCEMVEEILGKPSSIHGSYDLSDEWSTVTKIYKTNGGEKVKVDYKYDSEADTEVVCGIQVPDGSCLCILSGAKDNFLKTDLTTGMFEQFVVNETTKEEILSVVGIPQAHAGCGRVNDIYYTTDGDRINLLYNDDGTVSFIHSYNLASGKERTF